jgi:hypothetical protein
MLKHIFKHQNIENINLIFFQIKNTFKIYLNVFLNTKTYIIILNIWMKLL